MTRAGRSFATADTIVDDLIFLTHFPKHVDSLRLRDKLSLIRAEKPDLFAQAKMKAMDNPVYAHRRAELGHAWEIQTPNFQGRLMFRAVCSCGHLGGNWRPECGPGPEATQEEITAAVYR